MKIRIGRIVAASAVWAAGVAFADAQSLSPPTFTAEQAARGEKIYAEQCQACHGPELDSSDYASPIRGAAFRTKWAGKSLADLFDFMSTQMPPTDPGSLPKASYADVLAYVLGKNDVAPSAVALPSEPEKLKTMAVPPVKSAP
jgi:mono/diheme cytochrome c family protein